MSIAIEILEDLWNIKLKYKGVPTRAFFISVPGHDNLQSRRNSLSKLHKNGFIEKKNGDWSITQTGEKYLKGNKRLKNFDSPFQKSSPKNLLLMFDIPESRQNERKWLRKHLIKFNYFMLQKSVWIGPSPLPKEFLNYIKKIVLMSSIKTFKLAKPYIVIKK